MVKKMYRCITKILQHQIGGVLCILNVFTFISFAFIFQDWRRITGTIQERCKYLVILPLYPDAYAVKANITFLDFY